MRGIDSSSQNDWPAEDVKESISEFKTVESVKINSSVEQPRETSIPLIENPWPGFLNALAIAIIGAAAIYALFWAYKKNKK